MTGETVPLNDGALDYLRQHTFSPSAERLSCLLPLGGIYWADEIPEFSILMDIPKVDRDQIFRLFSVRFKLWCEEELSDGDLQFWEQVRELVPDYPVFHRLELSAEDRAEQAAVEEEVVAEFSALLDGADDVTVNGAGSFSATFDLTNEEPKPLWMRVLAWFRAKS